MKKLILFLISRYNKNCKPEDYIEVNKPVIFSANSKSHFKDFDMKQQFCINMVKEKVYDLRHSLIEQIYKDGNMEETVSYENNQLEVELKLKVYTYEQKNQHEAGK